MKFGEVFGKSWSEYKVNFWSIAKVMLIFYAIPLLIITLFNSWWLLDSGTASVIAESYPNINVFSGDSYGNIDGALGNELFNRFSGGFLFVSLVLMALFLFISFIGCVGISNASLKKSKYSFSDLVKAGTEKYWAVLGFLIVLGIFLFGLTLLLIIPGIIFAVFWIFGYYVFLDEKKGVIYSLKKSFHIVRGRWWKTFGYLLLLLLIIAGISLVIQIPSAMIQMISLAIVSGKLSGGFIVFSNIVKQIFNIIASFITTPLMILFIKNFYLASKGKK